MSATDTVIPPRALDEMALIGELRRVELLRELPDERLRWLIACCGLVRLAPGEVHRAVGDPATHVFFLLEGEVRVTQRVAGRETVMATYGPGTLYGELPVLMGKAVYFAAGRAVTPCRVLEVPKETFWELVSVCPRITQAVVGEMARRVMELESVAQQRARLVSLGTLAAGLAHELNNPASAARRATAELEVAIAELKRRSIAIGRLLDDECLHAICAIYDEALDADHAGDAMERMAREEACVDWLEARGIAEPWTLAANLAEAALTPDRLERIAARVPAVALDEVLHWVEVRARAAALGCTSAQAAARVAALVDSVRGYTFLGQAPLLEVDLHEALDSTLAVLRPRLAALQVEREYADDLPAVRAWAGELNQVWTALLENAADALRDGGRVTVRTARDGDGVRVEVEDDGPGIAPEIQGRVFDPFFTTRDVGATGLGLSGAYRIVSDHGGTITFRSAPGRTVFEVRLPLDPPIPAV